MADHTAIRLEEIDSPPGEGILAYFAPNAEVTRSFDDDLNVSGLPDPASPPLVLDFSTWTIEVTVQGHFETTAAGGLPQAHVDDLESLFGGQSPVTAQDQFNRLIDMVVFGESGPYALYNEGDEYTTDGDDLYVTAEGRRRLLQWLADGAPYIPPEKDELVGYYRNTALERPFDAMFVDESALSSVFGTVSVTFEDIRTWHEHGDLEGGDGFLEAFNKALTAQEDNTDRVADLLPEGLEATGNDTGKSAISEALEETGDHKTAEAVANGGSNVTHQGYLDTRYGDSGGGGGGGGGLSAGLAPASPICPAWSVAV